MRLASRSGSGVRPGRHGSTKGARVFLVEEDIGERGLERADLVAGVAPVTRAGLLKLLAAYDQVWHW